MPKKGQITIFVILGIIILTIALSSLYLINKSSETIRKNEFTETSQLPIQLQKEKEKVEACISEIMEEGIILFGKNGGYIYSKPEKIINYNGADVAYLETITKPKAEEELSKYAIKELGQCNNDSEVKNAIIKIEPERILIEAEMPSTLSIGDESAEIKRFNAETGIKLGNILLIIGEIKKDKDCVSCLMDMVNNYKMKAAINIVDGGKIFVIQDENYEMEFAAD